MLQATYELAGDAENIANCQRDLNLSPQQCAALWQAAGFDPNLYAILARGAVIGLGTKACAQYVQSQTGVPATVAAGPCAWAVEKAVEAGEWVWQNTWGRITGEVNPIPFEHAKFPAGVLWYQTDNPDPPAGMHWVPGTSHSKAYVALNVAMLEKEGEPREVVYVPCEHIGASRQWRCRDYDGVMRATRTKEPYYWTGRFVEKGSSWPHQFETKPWSPAGTQPLSLRERLIASQGRTFSPTAQKIAPAYPHGSVTAQEPATGTWKIAAPRAELAGEAAWAIVDERSTQPAGLPVVPYTDLLRRTGELPWYKDWRIWAVAGGVAAAGTGVLLWKRRKRRKRR